MNIQFVIHRDWFWNVFAELSIDLSQKRSESVNARMRTEIDLNSKRVWDRSKRMGLTLSQSKCLYGGEPALLVGLALFAHDKVCVGYKMQISHSGFREEINVVSPGRRAGFSHVNARWNPALLLGLALPRGLALLHVNTPLLTLLFHYTL